VWHRADFPSWNECSSGGGLAPPEDSSGCLGWWAAFESADDLTILQRNGGSQNCRSAANADIPLSCPHSNFLPMHAAPTARVAS
jgi:hypothetical protein